MAPETLTCIENIVDLSSLPVVLDKHEFCKYLPICDEGYCGNGCSIESCNKCDNYHNFRRGIWA